MKKGLKVAKTKKVACYTETPKSEAAATGVARDEES